MRANPSWQLKGRDGKPINPEGKLAMNMTIAAVVAFYSGAIANLSAEGWVDGAFGDSGCGERPAWLPPEQQDAFASGQLVRCSGLRQNLPP
jgi:hypothetical protein